MFIEYLRGFYQSCQDQMSQSSTDIADSRVKELPRSVGFKLQLLVSFLRCRLDFARLSSTRNFLHLSKFATYHYVNGRILGMRKCTTVALGQADHPTWNHPTWNHLTEDRTYAERLRLLLGPWCSGLVVAAFACDYRLALTATCGCLCTCTLEEGRRKFIGGTCARIHICCY